MPDCARRDTLDGLDLEDLEAEPSEQRQVARSPSPKAKVGAGGNCLDPDRTEIGLGKLFWFEALQRLFGVALIAGGVLLVELGSH